MEEEGEERVAQMEALSTTDTYLVIVFTTTVAARSCYDIRT